MNHNLTIGTIGALGITAKHLLDSTITQTPSFDPSIIPTIIKLLGDAVIAVLTIWGLFKKAKAKMLLLPFLFAAATATAQRIETAITPGGDYHAIQFNIYNDSGTDKYLASAMISIEGNYDICDSGYQITATTPVVTDTAVHTAVPPQALFSQNKTRFTFYFKENHRLRCPAHSVTEIAKDTIIAPNIRSTCSFRVVYSNPQINNFVSISSGPGSNPSYITNWWQFFITQ